MQHWNRIAVIAALFSFAAAASAGDDKAKNKDEGQICTYESVVGSHFPKRVCATASQRDDARRNAQDDMQHVHQLGGQMPSTAGGMR